MSFSRTAGRSAPPGGTINSSPSSSTDPSFPVGAIRMVLSPISIDPASAALFCPAITCWISCGETPVVASRARVISRYITSIWSPSISIFATSSHSSSSRRSVFAYSRRSAGEYPSPYTA